VPDRYDLIVLGLGVGGVEVASQCARSGRSVLAVEQRLVDGECPY
jgi:pyruvate/2-oxoglutarate dehydrogenase complex dihydrolipoamide dehydrogenase (E3) component